MMRCFARRFPSLAAASALLCLFTVACSQPANGITDTRSARMDDPPVNESPQSTATLADAGGDATAIASGLRKGMAYGSFRALLLEHGWEPVADPACRANLLGADPDTLCAADPQLLNCRICDELPELQSCSGDARCLVRFRHAASGSELEARAYGEVEYWNDTGEDAGLQLTDWEFVAPSGG
jgi:hypothetical protein